MSDIKFISMNNVIPKVIHQTYSETFLPAKIRKNIRRLQNLNPDWYYKFYSDKDIEDYIAQHFSDLLGDYLSINPKYGAVRADFFRYLLLYNEGGVYLDIKSSFSKPLSTTIQSDDKYILSHWGRKGQFAGWGNHAEISDPKGEFQQCFIISTKGHPFIRAVLEKVVDNIRNYDSSIQGVGRDAVLRLSGPVAYTLAIYPLLSLYDHRLVKSEKDLGYIYSIYRDGGHVTHFKTHYSDLTESIISNCYGTGTFDNSC